jgi:UDP-GlcNAc:undecaprenyl-phosphate/decaprenyl-phosphate GlcNAc-1-phosphate transferase
VLPDEVRLIAAALGSLTASWILTRGALRLAVRLRFYDFPVGYKSHAAPTAYLGGVAVLCGWLPAALVFGEGSARFAPITVCAVGLCVIGTFDDRYTLPPSRRIVAEGCAAGILVHYGLGWSFIDGMLVQFALTAIWVIAFANAFNLMDNMDGAAGTVACVCAAGLAVQSLIADDPALAALATAVAGACIGFLPYNLRRGAPARIFLGDGGSVPIGFLLAATAMSIPEHRFGWPMILIGGMLLALPVLDTILVVVSRARRHVPIVAGGRDHLTHRLQSRLASPRRVAAALAAAQALTSLLAIVSAEGGRTTVIISAIGLLTLGAAIVALLEHPTWARREREPGQRLARSSPGSRLREP